MEQFWADSNNNAGGVSTGVMLSGVVYTVTIDGNWTPWNEMNYQYGVGNTVPVKYPSPNRSTGSVWANADAEFDFASPDRSASAATNHSHLAFQWSLDNGATWIHSPEPLDGVPAQFRPDHKYRYRMVGQGHPLKVRYTDPNPSDNNGRFLITLEEPLGGWSVGALAWGGGPKLVTVGPDVPGPLLILYDAREEVKNHPDGYALTTLTDYSGNGFHATATTPAPILRHTGGPNNGPWFDLSNGSAWTIPNYYWQNPNGTGAALYSALEAHATIKPNTATNRGGVWSLSYAYDRNHHPYSGTVYDAGFSNLRRTIGPVVEGWQRFSTMGRAGKIRFWRNNAQIYTEDSCTLHPLAQGSLGDQPGSGWGFNGGIARFVIFGRELTDPDRATVDTWAV